MISVHHIFWYNPVSLKKDRTSSILTFSNRSVKLFTLKTKLLSDESKIFTFYENVFNGPRSLTYQILWWLFLFQYERVSKPCMTNAQSGFMTCSLFNFLKSALHSPKVGWIWKSLLWMLLSHHCCHFVWGSLLISGFRSVSGILNLLGVRSKADLAAKSALSFPLTPKWLRIKHIIISLRFDIESSLPKSLIMKGFSSFFIA